MKMNFKNEEREKGFLNFLIKIYVESVKLIPGRDLMMKLYTNPTQVKQETSKCL